MRRLLALAVLLAFGTTACARSSADDGVALRSRQQASEGAGRTAVDAPAGARKQPRNSSAEADTPSAGRNKPRLPYSLPALGTFGYNTSLDLGPEAGQYSGTRTLSYYPPSASGDSMRMTVRQTTQVKGSPPKEWWFRLLWRPGGVYREADINPSSGSCTMRPALLELPLPATVGATWKSRSVCAESGLIWRLEGKVERAETLRVAGRTVEVLRIERTLYREYEGADSKPLLETRWFSPRHAIDVRMRTEGAGAPVDLLDTLVSLRPEALPTRPRPKGF